MIQIHLHMDDVYDDIDEYSLTKKNFNCVWWYPCRYYD